MSNPYRVVVTDRRDDEIVLELEAPRLLVHVPTGTVIATALLDDALDLAIEVGSLVDYDDPTAKERPRAIVARLPK